MDLLLAHGYFLADDPAEQAVMRPYPPLGILYISAYLKARGFSVAVFDSTFQTIDTFAELIDRERPPVVGLYCNLMTRPNVLKMMRLAKHAGSTVVLGGPEPINYADEYVARGADVVVAGEGEHVLAELLPCLASSDRSALQTIPGLVFYLHDRLVRTGEPARLPNLDALPMPDRDAIDIRAYIDVWRAHHGLGSVSLITARGCPYTCTWCSHATFGFTHRRRSPANVADELQLIVDMYHPDMVWYADDVFTISHRWLHGYAEELARRGLRVPFETISREDRLNKDVVRTLARMGCFRLWIGAESGSQRVLDAMQRGTDAARTREMVRLLQRHGIEAGTFIMLGYEGEELGDIAATVAHLKAAPPDRVLTTVAYPIKGTAYYARVADRVLPLAEWEEGSDRDTTMAGRHSRRFYRYATRWIVAEVALEKARRQGRPSYKRLLRNYVSAKVGRLGMRLSEHETEPAEV
ncbi:MAG: B12-binding domain-containing radical SAM protein [Acidobacteria bacterium]|nr:B12-binding domain-containing radical SAM protein [Acidobacteriota bacterium]